LAARRVVHGDDGAGFGGAGLVFPVAPLGLLAGLDTFGVELEERAAAAGGVGRVTWQGNVGVFRGRGEVAVEAAHRATGKHRSALLAVVVSGELDEAVTRYVCPQGDDEPGAEVTPVGGLVQ